MTFWKHRWLTRLGSRNARPNHRPLEVIQFLPDDDGSVTCFYLEEVYFFNARSLMNKLHGGGVAFFVRKDILVNEIDLGSDGKHLDILCLDLLFGCQ